MGLSQALHSASSGIGRAQSGLATVSHNLANADTEGYRRQRVIGAAYDPVSLGSSGQLGTGVQVQSITHAVDRFLERQMLRDQTLSGFYNGRATTLSAAERLHAEATTPNVGGSMDAFFNAARELSQDPSNGAARAAFVSSAQNVASAFNVLDRDLRALQDGIDDTLGSKVDQVNHLGAQIAKLNARITSSEVDGSMANDLRDQRDEAISALSELVDVNVMLDGDGAVNIDIGGQIPLVRDNVAGTLETAPDPGNQGLLAIQFVPPGGGTPRDVTRALEEGEIGGLLETRDTHLGGQRAELDTLAFAFADSVNATHAAGFDTNGNTNQALFEPLVGPAGAAASLTVVAAVIADPELVAAAQDVNGLPGDNRNMLAMADLGTAGQALLNGDTYARRHSEMVHEVGRVTAENNDRKEMHSVRASQSASMVESVAGVSVDDEMLDLSRYQKHFEASSRVISTVDQLLDSVLALVR